MKNSIIFILYFFIVFLTAFNISHSHLTTVASGSMEPLLHPGDVVILDTNIKQLEVGDIIVYHATWSNEPCDVLHRIVQKQQQGEITVYRTQGDNHLTNPYPDPELIYPNQIKSKLATINGQSLIIPRIGYIILLLKGL